LISVEKTHTTTAPYTHTLPAMKGEQSDIAGVRLALVVGGSFALRLLL
jgi:hypothetical protein